MPSCDKRKVLEDAFPPMYGSGACDVCFGDVCAQLLTDADGCVPWLVSTFDSPQNSSWCTYRV